jgi:hypothetical protein
LEELAKVAHAFGEVVGLGLRNPTQCPVELNLIPKSILKRQQLSQKKPYFIASVFSLILAVFAFGWFFDKVAAVKGATLEGRSPVVTDLQSKEEKLKTVLDAKKKTQSIADQYSEWMDSRFTWADMLMDLRKALVATEEKTRRPGLRTGVWVEKMAAEGTEFPESATEEEEGPRPMMMDFRMLQRYGLIPKGYKFVPVAGGGGDSEGGGGGSSMMMSYTPKAAAKAAQTNEISVINLTCRAVSWSKAFPTADSELAIALEKELLTSRFFAGGTNGTQLAGSMQPNEENNTFSFEVRLKLKKPIRL